MTLLQALAYFLREALLNLLRGWKVSLLVAVTIGVSLFVGGLFLLLSAVVAGSVESWRGEARVVAYLADDVDELSARGIAGELERSDWVRVVEWVTPEAARDRFAAAFPGLSELLEGEEALPASLEIAIDEQLVEPDRLVAWTEELRRRPEITLVDDDRTWLRQVGLFARLLRTVGYGLGGLLLVAAVLTTASVIRLTAHVYRQEISVLRLVGGTDFFIRGPFVVEGLLQGLAGGLLAALCLLALGPLAHGSLPDLAGPGLTASLTPAWPTLVALIGCGGSAGFVGALLSLRHQRVDL